MPNQIRNTRDGRCYYRNFVCHRLHQDHWDAITVTITSNNTRQSEDVGSAIEFKDLLLRH